MLIVFSHPSELLLEQDVDVSTKIKSFSEYNNNLITASF